MAKQRTFSRSILILLSSIALLALGIGPVAAAPGDVTVFAGPTGTTAGFAGDGLPVDTNTRFNLPHGAAVYGQSLYIADVNNNRIRKVDLTTNIITTVVGGGTDPGEGVLATNAQLSAPYGVAVDGQGNIYIGDVGNNRIRKVDLTTNLINTVAGGGTDPGEGVLATNAQLSAPYGMAVDGQGNLYIADAGNNRIRKVDTSGIITTVVGGTAGWVDGPLASGQLNAPFDVTVNAQGTLLYIADFGNNRLRKVDLVAGTIETEIQASPPITTLSAPRGVVVDSQGDVYVGVSGGGAVMKYDPITETFSPAYLMANPTGVAIDEQGNVYAVGHTNNRIYKIESVSPVGPISEWRAEGNANDLNGANNGTLNGATFAAGRLGQAFSLDGSSYVSVPNGTGSLNPTGSLTLSAWVFPTQDAYQPFIVKWGDLGAWGAERAYALSMQAGRSLSFSIASDNQADTGLHNFGSPPGVVTLNAWNHVAGVYDQTTGNRWIYVNGVEVQQGTVTPGTTIKNSSADLGIGAWIQAPGIVNPNTLNGEIDEVRIYGRALSASDIQNLVFFEITATAGANGSIAPPGKTTLNFDDSQAYTITPDAGHQVADVLVDGSSQGAVSTHNFTNVTADHTIDASFASSAVTVSVPTVTATYNQALTIPVSISEASGLVAAEVTVEYDTDLLTLVTPVPAGVTSTGTLTDGWSVEYNTEPGGGPSLEKVKIAVATDVNAVTGAATLVNIQFTVNNVRTPATSALTLSDVLLNDGDPTNVTVDGSVTLVGNDATIVFSSGGSPIPRESITVVVTDADEDSDGNPSTDQITVSVTNGAQTETLTLNETATPGEFSGTIPTVFAANSTDVSHSNDNTVQAKAGDDISFSYTDQLDASGNGPIPRTIVANVIGGTDGTIVSTIVTQPGDLVYIRVTDADLNTDDGLQESVVVTALSSTTESENNIVLTEDGIDSDIFFGSVATTTGAIPGPNNDGPFHTQKGDVLTITYDDVVTAVGDQLNRVDDDEVVDPFGDADGNGQTQAFDAFKVLLHSLSPFLTGLDSLASNVDALAFDPVAGKITPFDATLVLKKRVGLIAAFPVQADSADNHPQPETDNSVPKALPDLRLLSLQPNGDYVSVWADERAGILSGELLIEDLDGQVEMASELSKFLSASQLDEEGLHIVFAGAQEVSGPGELLRIYPGVGPDKAQLTRAHFNDGRIVGQVEALATPVTIPATFALHTNWPNPFNPETTIAFDLPQAGSVELQVFDLLGQTVRTLVAQELSAGGHQVVWNGLDESGARVGSGVYFYRLQAGSQVQMRRMLLLK